jgi:hypothetical protein
MNRTLRTITLAAPLATVALGLGATTAHAAQPVGPPIDELTIKPKPIVDPELPHGPIDKIGPVDPGDPGDPEPDPEPGPGDGPDDKAGPKPCEHDCDHGDDDDHPGDKGHDDPTDIPRPTRVDAGIGSSDEGLELGWALAGGALVTATGAAYAVRRRARVDA